MAKHGRRTNICAATSCWFMQEPGDVTGVKYDRLISLGIQGTAVSLLGSVKCTNKVHNTRSKTDNCVVRAHLRA